MSDFAKENGGDIGVLIGWRCSELGSKIVLTLQSKMAGDDLAKGQYDERRYFLTKNQAAVLANFLTEVSGCAQPRRNSRSWLSRLLER